jgi:hypothetical protein
VFWLIRRHSLKTITGEPVVLAPKGMKPGLVLGGLMFGAAWALSGTCPGTALAQLGEGKFAALATVAGIALSSALTEAWLARAESRRVMSASSRTTPA